MERINKKYLGAALTVSASAIAGPFAINYSIPENFLPYFFATGYFVICSTFGVMEFLDNRSAVKKRESPKKYCNGSRRMTIEELIREGYLS